MKYLIYLFLPIIMTSCSDSKSERSTAEKSGIAPIEDSKSVSLSITAKSKDDSKVVIDYLIVHRGNHNFYDRDNSLNQDLKQCLLDSLHEYEVFDMYTVKRYSLQLAIERIVQRIFPKVDEVILTYVEMTKEKLELFNQIQESELNRLDSIQKARQKAKLSELKEGE